MEPDGKGKEGLLDLDDPLAKPPEGKMRDRQMTLADDDVTEQARIASVLIESSPPPAGVATDGEEAIRARLAPLGRVPETAKTLSELGEELKEPRIAFVLGFIDGVLPLETIVEVTGLPEIETLRILERLIADGAIVFPTAR